MSRFFPCLGTVDISPPISNVCVRKSLARRILSKCGRSALLSSRVKTQSHPSVARFVVGLRELRAVTLEAMTLEKCMTAAPSPAASRIFRVSQCSEFPDGERAPATQTGAAGGSGGGCRVCEPQALAGRPPGVGWVRGPGVQSLGSERARGIFWVRHYVPSGPTLRVSSLLNVEKLFLMRFREHPGQPTGLVQVSCCL